MVDLVDVVFVLTGKIKRVQFPKSGVWKIGNGRSVGTGIRESGMVRTRTSGMSKVISCTLRRTPGKDQ